MPRIVEEPCLITAAGEPPKRIGEFVGRVGSRDHGVRVARRKSPAGKARLRSSVRH